MIIYNIVGVFIIRGVRGFNIRGFPGLGFRGFRMLGVEDFVYRVYSSGFLEWGVGLGTQLGRSRVLCT